jgi:chromosome segregation ATPase
MANQHHLNMDEAKAYLNDLTPAIEAYNLELQIKDQNAAVTAAETKYKNLTNEGADLEKRKEELDRKLHNNKMQQQTQLNEIELQKQKLATKVSERKA